MRYSPGKLLGVAGIAYLATGLAAGAPTVVAEPMGPDGDTVGATISPHGNHVGALAVKGSRFVVLLDGVAGPKIEALQSAVYGSPYQAGNFWQGEIPFLFSNDGSHSAYIAKMGEEYVIFEDGKELVRGPLVTNGTANITVPLEFSPGGKHLFYMDVDPATGKFRIMVDGKPGPGSGFPTPLVISPDGEHYAYTGFAQANIGNGVANWAVVDGRQINPIGDNLQYTGRNVLMSTTSIGGFPVLVFNGKPAIKAAGISPMWLSPDGGQIALIITPTAGAQSFLSVDGKTVPDTQGINVSNVYFSPNGKRYAALCSSRSGSKFMIIDGKKGEVYQTIPAGMNLNPIYHRLFGTGDTTLETRAATHSVPGFTPDSSKFVYVAQQGGRSFLVVEDQESDGFDASNSIEPTLSENGNRIGWVAVAPNGIQHVLIDDKDQAYSSFNAPGISLRRISCLTFSPQSTHYAFLDGQNLAVDGVDQPGFIDGTNYVFSPDDQHLAYPANIGDRECMVVDRKIVATATYSVAYAFFSPDSQHIIWVRKVGTPGSKDFHVLSVDGVPAVHYGESGSNLNPVFEFSADGTVLTFVSRTDGSLRRFHVTMPSDTSVSTMLAAAPTAK